MTRRRMIERERAMDNRSPSGLDVSVRYAGLVQGMGYAAPPERFTRWNVGKQMYEVIEGRIVATQREKPE